MKKNGRRDEGERKKKGRKRNRVEAEEKGREKEARGTGLSWKAGRNTAEG